MAKLSTPSPRKRSRSPSQGHEQKQSVPPVDAAAELQAAKRPKIEHELDDGEATQVLSTKEGKDEGTEANPASEDLPADPSTPDQTREADVRYPSPPGLQATDLDKSTWGGFCEMESEPAFFSVMLREIGVKGTSVREILGLDPELLALTPSPIYGLILLYRYRSMDVENQEKICPEDVWFANQMPVQNSCATLAMINILMNATDVDIGENLQQFKQFTDRFTPYQRGEALANFEFVKRIHNSFAKKMDMLEADYNLQKKANAKKHHRRDSDSSSDDIEEAHHFIAFMPIGNAIWKLDGMDAFPTKVGECEVEEDDDCWLNIVANKIASIIAAADGAEGADGSNLEYSLVAITKSPLATHREALSETVATLRLVDNKLDQVNEDWKGFMASEDAAEPLSPTFLTTFGIEPDTVTSDLVPAEVQAIISEEDFEELINRRIELAAVQSHLPEEIEKEQRIEEDEQDKADQRRFDYGPVIKLWCEKLAESGYLDQHLQDYMGGGV